MGTIRPESPHSLQDGVFIGLTLSIGGGLLMETWLFIIHAGLPMRLVGAMPWLSLGILAVLRKRRSTSCTMGVSAEHAMPASIVSNAGWAIVLLVVGGGLGFLIMAGGALVLMTFTTACGFMPWHRIRLCRQQPGRASLIMCSGGAIVLGFPHTCVDSMFLPIAAWALGMSSLVTFTRTMRPQTFRRKAAEANAAPVRL